MIEWTIDDVAGRFSEAAETGRRLPPVRVQGHFNLWPPFVRSELEAFCAEGNPPRHFPPSPAAVDRMLETMTWVQWLEVEQRHLVWMRAQHYEWDQIGRRFGCCRSTAWRRWKLSLQVVVEQLNTRQ